MLDVANADLLPVWSQSTRHSLLFPLCMIQAKHLLFTAAAIVVGGILLHRRALSQRKKRRVINDGKPRVCLCASGSVAAVKVPELAELLMQKQIRVDVVLTEAAAFFQKVDYKGTTPWSKLEALCSQCDEDGVPWVEVWCDQDEWSHYESVKDDQVVHIELAKRSQVLLFAPLSANTLGQVANGLSTNLLTSLARAWYYDMNDELAGGLKIKYGAQLSKPVLAAPAMNTYMYYQRVTAQHLATLKARGIQIVDPVEKKLACGDFGTGALAAPDVIVAQVAAALLQYQEAVAGMPVFQP